MMVFLPKEGKSNYKDAKDFRPNRLTSFLIRRLERLIDRFKREPLHYRPYACERDESMETAVRGLAAKMKKRYPNWNTDWTHSWT